MSSESSEVLVVEDDTAMSILLHEELKEEGYRVRVVHNGDEAIEAIQESVPDIVALDINMPGKDGIQTLQEITNRWGDLPVVIHTAYSAYKDNYQLWAAAEYVVKSSDFSDLKSAIARLLEERASSSQNGGSDGSGT